MTTLTIDGREHPLRHLWLPEMSLSSSRTGRASATYVLEVDRDTILSALSDPYEQYVRESKEDDELTGTTDLLGQAGYPPLDAVLDDPDLLSEALGGYGLSDELFRAVLPAASGQMLGTWAIDTVDEVRRDGERIVFTGTCYAF
jgi:hypothetical protein